MKQSREETIRLLQNVQDPQIIREKRVNDARRKYEQLLSEVNIVYDETTGNELKYGGELQQFIHFYKLLARRPDSEQSQLSVVNRLKLWVPDTIVLNDRDMPNYWLYTDPRGYVFRTDTFTPKNVVSKLANYTSPDELVAVVKKQQFKNMELAGNEVKLVCCRDMLNTASGAFQNRVDLTVLQKYIKSNGPKAFICRTVWRKDRNPISYVVTNKADYFEEGVKNENHKYITNMSIMGSCTIVKTCRGKYIEETVPYIKNILTYLQIHLHTTFKMFAADFIKDESGIWWFMNVKGFLIEKSPEKIFIRAITHYGEDAPIEEGGVDPFSQSKLTTKKAIELCQKYKHCKYCEQCYAEQQLSHKMTLKMIIQTDKHLYWRGKAFTWIERSDITNLEISNLYQEHKVCKQCYNLYKETEQLIELQLQFNRLLGVPTSEDTNYQMLTLKANEVNNDPVKPTQGFQGESVEDTQVFDISATKQLVLTNNVPTIHSTVIKQLNRLRFMVLIHSIKDVPLSIDMGKYYYIEYQIFEQKHRFRIDVQGQHNEREKGFFVHLNRMRLFYLFSNNRKGWNEYVNQVKVLTMYLYQDQTRIGSVEIELQDFLSERVVRREFLKVFSVQNIYPILSWQLNLTLGLVDSGLTNVTKLKLHDYNGIYLPHNDYTTCEPLPAEWMTILNQKKDQEQLNRIMERQQTSQTLKRTQTAGAKLQKVEKSYDPALRHEIESFNDSTKELNSQINMLKEIQDYEVDEELKQRNKRRHRPMYEL